AVGTCPRAGVGPGGDGAQAGQRSRLDGGRLARSRRSTRRLLYSGRSPRSRHAPGGRAAPTPDGGAGRQASGGVGGTGTRVERRSAGGQVGPASGRLPFPGGAFDG